MDDESWKATLTDPSMNDRKYAESIREAVRKMIKEDGQYVFWLVGVREGKEGKVCQGGFTSRCMLILVGFLAAI
jgi:hypothetical protein